MKFTHWVSLLVVKEMSNGKMRVRYDPNDLKKSTLRSHYPMKTPNPERCSLLLFKAFFKKLDKRNRTLRAIYIILVNCPTIENQSL